MKSIGLFTCILVVLFPTVFSGVSTPILDFDSFDPIFARAGESLTITAIVSPSNFANYQILEVVRRNLLTFEETLLGSIADYTNVITSVAGYQVSVTTVSVTQREAHLLIESLSLDADGSILFNLKSTTGSINGTVIRPLTVVVPPESVTMQIGNLYVLDSNSSLSVSVGPGVITITCVVEGSNPAVTDVRIILNGDDVTLATGPDSALESADERKYLTNATAMLEIPSNFTGTQTLVCAAIDYFGEWHSVQFVYQNGRAPEGHRPVLGLVFVLTIASLWCIL